MWQEDRKAAFDDVQFKFQQRFELNFIDDIFIDLVENMIQLTSQHMTRYFPRKSKMFRSKHARISENQKENKIK